MRSPLCLTWLCALLFIATPAHGQMNEAPDQPAAGGELVSIDREKREVRVRCQALRVEMPLEFICVLAGTTDHETVLRTVAKPSAIHAALLGLGLKPGGPLRFVPERKTWIAPHGPPLRVEVEWEQDGRIIRKRAEALVRHIKTGEPMPPRVFVFCGSQTVNGDYAADATGQLVSLVNFEYSTIDVPDLASNSNETLEWEINPQTAPPDGATAWMVLTPVEDDGATTRATTRSATPAAEAAGPIQVIVVALTGQGEVRVNNEAVALAEAGQVVRQRSAGAEASVRLTAPRGAPIDALGRLLAKLAEAELTDVTFVPAPAQVAADGLDWPADGDVPNPFARGTKLFIGGTVAVHDGGREVTVDGERAPLGQFIASVRERTPSGLATEDIEEISATYGVRPAADATDVKAVDIAAVHAALHVMGYHVNATYPASASSTRPAAGDAAEGASLADLRARWERELLPQSKALRDAAQAHYEVMEVYQAEINRLIDAAEKLRREMDALQARYNELTTPRPATMRGVE